MWSNLTLTQVFNGAARNLVLQSLDGINGTVFAYGQTGSGKTFTITGGPQHYSDRGIIPRAISLIFSSIAERKDTQYTVMAHRFGAERYCYLYESRMVFTTSVQRSIEHCWMRSKYRTAMSAHKITYYCKLDSSAFWQPHLDICPCSVSNHFEASFTCTQQTEVSRGVQGTQFIALAA